MNTTFYLVRHGMRESRNEDTFLSEIGRKQADITGQHLENFNIAAIYASPLLRTEQTAKIINQHLGLEIKTDDRLRERMEWDFSRESFDQFLAEWNKTSDRDYQPVHGDSSRGAGNRVKQALDEIEQDGNILIVTHGGVIGDFLRNVVSDESLQIALDQNSGTKYLEINECSITIVERKDNTYIVKSVNDVSHLPTPVL